MGGMTALTFERGKPDAPAGHAFLYFPTGNEGQVAATYLVVPPVPLDFGKYVPPLLASSLGASGLVAQTSFLPIPPVPEQFSLAEVRRLAQMRGDDILVAANAPGLDLTGLMAFVAEIGDAYARAYEAAAARSERAASEPVSSGTLDGVALLYSVLSERERLEEIARRLGTLRYAEEGGDRAQAEATRAEIRAIGEYLPERYRLEELIEAASSADPSSARLAQLFVERGYRLCSDDTDGVRSIDDEIAILQRGR